LAPLRRFNRHAGTNSFAAPTELFHTWIRSVVALALITLIVVVILSLVMARQFEQPSWIAKAVHGAADASAPPP
jgi:hypothetical protein